MAILVLPLSVILFRLESSILTQAKRATNQNNVDTERFVPKWFCTVTSLGVYAYIYIAWTIHICLCMGNSMTYYPVSLLLLFLLDYYKVNLRKNNSAPPPPSLLAHIHRKKISKVKKMDTIINIFLVGHRAPPLFQPLRCMSSFPSLPLPPPLSTGEGGGGRATGSTDNISYLEAGSPLPP